MTVSLAAIAIIAATAPVELRGGEIVDQPIVAIDERGVEVGGDAPRTIGWDRVKDIAGERAEAYEPFADIADAAWRARTRLERGDDALAEPLFEQLYEQYEAGEGPTAELVCQGLMLCRARRSAVVDAIEPWLVTVRQLSDGRERRTWPFGAPSLDDETFLLPLAPPIWLPGPALDAYIRSAPSVDRSESPLAAAFEDWYRYAARAASGQASAEPPPLPSELETHPGLRFVSQIVLAMEGEKNARLAARDWLQGHINRSEGDWSEAWARAAVGRSLLRQPTQDDKVEGMVHLLHIPARFGASQPYLAGIALAEVSAALDAAGRTADAERLLRRLETHYPGHPGIEWRRTGADDSATRQENPSSS